MSSREMAEIIRRPDWRSLILRQVRIILRHADNIAMTDHNIIAIMKAAREIRDICDMRRS